MAETSSSRGVSAARRLRASDGRFDIREHAELREDHRSRGVAVERLDLAVHETEDVTARRVHPLARWRKDPHRRRQGSLVRTLEGEFDDDDIADVENPVQLAMHVRKRRRIDLDRLAEAGGAVGPAVGNADLVVGKRPVGREGLNPTLDVHFFGHLVRFANDLFVVHRKVPSARSAATPTCVWSIASALPRVERVFLKAPVGFVLAYKQWRELDLQAVRQAISSRKGANIVLPGISPIVEISDSVRRRLTLSVQHFKYGREIAVRWSDSSSTKPWV